jgi:hypothetical protein
MSQLSSSVSLPQIAYRGVPVVTTETLARAYEVKPINIQKNFSANKDRFVEGKHYYTISGNDLKEFKNCLTESKSVEIGKRTATLTLWTERGAARHAKMLNSDRAWDMFELLEETFFRVARPASLPDESPSFPGSVSITPSTVEDRKPLRALVNAWAHVSAQPFNVCWTQLKAAFRLTDIRDLPQEWIPDALAWVQAKIDALSAGSVPARTTALPASNVYADRVKALTDLEKRFMEFSIETRTRLSALNAEYTRLNQGAYAAMLGMIPTMDFAARDRLIEALTSQSYDAYNLIDEGLHCMRRVIIAARAANRVLSGRS